MAGNNVWPGSVIRYLSVADRKAFEISIINGRLFTIDGLPFDTSATSSVFSGGEGRAIFVMDENGTFYASKTQKVGEFHHSSLVAGEPVAAAGELAVADGELTLLSDRSGHYKPNQELTRQALMALESSGVDFGNGTVILAVKSLQTSMLTTREKGLIRALMYPVQFDDNPVESVEHVIRNVVKSRSLNASEEEYATAIKKALRSDENLADILPSEQNEHMLREYLVRVGANLAGSDAQNRQAVIGETVRVVEERTA